jgi:hypothetical protein
VFLGGLEQHSKEFSEHLAGWKRGGLVDRIFRLAQPNQTVWSDQSGLERSCPQLAGGTGVDDWSPADDSAISPGGCLSGNVKTPTAVRINSWRWVFFYLKKERNFARL